MTSISKGRAKGAEDGRARSGLDRDQQRATTATHIPTQSTLIIYKIQINTKRLGSYKTPE